MKSEDYKKYIEESGLFIFIVYIAGFFAWNFYLSHFGFFEFDLLQTRFFSAGILVLAIPILVLGFSQKIRSYLLRKNILTHFILYIFWVYIFTIFIFPSVPQYFGGAVPSVASIMGSRQFLNDLSVAGIPLAPAGNGNDSVETIKACKIYQDKDFVLFGFIFTPTSPAPGNITIRPNRVLLIKQDQIEAQSILPESGIIADITCQPLLLSYGVNIFPTVWFYNFILSAINNFYLFLAWMSGWILLLLRKISLLGFGLTSQILIIIIRVCSI